jgi:hypothetical protein
MDKEMIIRLASFTKEEEDETDDSQATHGYPQDMANLKAVKHEAALLEGVEADIEPEHHCSPQTKSKPFSDAPSAAGSGPQRELIDDFEQADDAYDKESSGASEGIV